MRLSEFSRRSAIFRIDGGHAAVMLANVSKRADVTRTKMAEMKAPMARPLSPHLQIYKPLFTMMMSIVHRITGCALYFGTILVVWWLIAAASGPSAYATFQWAAGSFLGRLVLFGYTWALFHHLAGGVRHLIWDTGAGLGKGTREMIAKASLVFSVAATILVWIIAYMVR